MKKTNVLKMILSFMMLSAMLLACMSGCGSACAHEYSGECDISCNLCGVLREVGVAHTYPDSLTCEDMTCSVCGYVLHQTHDYKVISSKPATLLVSGRERLFCEKCSDSFTNIIEKIDPEKLGLPVIYIEDIDEDAVPLYDLKKDDGEITVKYKYVSNTADVEDFEAFCEIKIQGSSSVKYPKKNFTVKFYEDEQLDNKKKVDLGWGAQNKYCMKANWIDFSQSRNVVAAKLYAQVVQQRANAHPRLLDTPNYGVIDGFPVLVYLNGEFHGNYTMNIPKDKWAYDMDDDESKKEAAFMADTWEKSCMLQEIISPDLKGWEIEHCSTKDETWVRESFNELIRLINCGSDDTIKRELENHLDIDAAIDNMLYTFAISAKDNIGKNTLWLTYDGKIWIPDMYDMDGTFGIQWDGYPIVEDGSVATHKPILPTISSSGSFTFEDRPLYNALARCFPERVEARWWELRETVLSMENIEKEFSEFINQIPDVAYESDSAKWDGIPSPETNNYEGIIGYTSRHLARIDEFFEKFNG